MNNLEDENHKWNQFELNKEKFNVVTSYEEKHYTTELDHSVIPQQIKEKADLIVKDILENSPLNNNLHLMEERGFIDQADGDEEDKYSSVLRNENSQHIN